MTGDDRHLLTTIRLAERAAARGDYPFAAILADADGNAVLEAENTVNSSADRTAHAEINLLRAASARFDLDQLATFTLYTNAEPCAMCAAAIYWNNIRRLVFGLSLETLVEIATGAHAVPVLEMSCREVFDRSGGRVDVVGPHLENAARVVHEQFWSAARESLSAEASARGA